MTHADGKTVDVARPAQIGAWLFALWGVLHVWVGVEGVHQYLTGRTSGLWNMLIGGRGVAREAFVHATDPVTTFTQGKLRMTTPSDTQPGRARRILRSPLARVLMLGFLLLLVMGPSFDVMTSYTAQSAKAVQHTIALAVAGFAL